MDLDLREAFDHGFGPEPAHRPVSERLEAGHRAVRRRRLAGTVVTVAAAAVLGLGTVAVLGGDGYSPSRVATDPTSDPTAEAVAGWAEGEFARYDAEGNLEVRPDVTVLDRIESPLPSSAGFDSSVALDLDYEGDENWILMTRTTQSDGSGSESGSGAVYPGGTDKSFEAWVAQQVERMTTPTPEDDSAGYVKFGEDGRLVSSHEVEILDQVLDPGFKNFVLAGEPSAAALLQGPDGKKWYVAVRDSGGLDVIAVPFKAGGPDLDAFVEYARERYVSGVGLR